MPQEMLILGARLDWFGLGLGSANKTGALIALMLIACWYFAFINWRWGKWLSLILSIPLAILLSQTESRGALVGVATGATVLLFFTKLKIDRFTLGLVAALLFGLVVTGTGQTFLERIIYSPQDSSALLRIDLFKSGLKMMWDAPEGWGIGNCGDAYTQWYQAPGTEGAYRTLLNSQMNWLVENNWTFRLIYPAFFGLVLAFIYPNKKQPILLISLAIWTTLLFSSLFSTITEYWVLWIIPITSIFAVTCFRIRNRVTVPKTVLLGSVAASYSLFAMIYGFGYLLNTSSIIKRTDDYVIIGKDAPDILIASPDKNVLGKKFGHNLRVVQQATGQTIMVLYNLDSLTEFSVAPIIVRTGKNLDHLEIPSQNKLILLNPDTHIDESALLTLSNSNVKIFFGEYYASQKASAWRQFSKEKDNISFSIVPGAEEFVPTWPNIVSNI